MKVNFDAVLLDLKGDPIKAGSEPGSPDATLGFVASIALTRDSQDDLAKKLRVYRVLKLIVESEGKGPVDIASEDVALVKEKIGSPGFNNPIIVGRCVELLEG